MIEVTGHLLEQLDFHLALVKLTGKTYNKYPGNHKCTCIKEQPSETNSKKINYFMIQINFTS